MFSILCPIVLLLLTFFIPACSGWSSLFPVEDLRIVFSTACRMFFVRQLYAASTDSWLCTLVVIVPFLWNCIQFSLFMLHLYCCFVEFVKELVSDRCIKVKVSGYTLQNRQTDRPGNTTLGVLSVTLFLVAINGILGELGNKVNESLFAGYLALYIKTTNQGQQQNELGREY